MRRFTFAVLTVLTVACVLSPVARAQCGPNGCARPGATVYAPAIQAMYAAPLYHPGFAPTSCPAGGSCAPGACASGACAASCPAGACGLAYPHVHVAPAAPIYQPQYTPYEITYAPAPRRFRLFRGRLGGGLRSLFGGCCGG